MAVNLEYYRTFYHVANEGSMGKAAERMCLTPPTVTKTIQALEQQLDCRLFTRSAKGVRLTAAGEALYAHVKPGLNLLDSGELEVNMLNSLEGGKVRIGMSEAAAHYFTMPAVFETFCTKYPKVQLEIKHLPTSDAKDKILSGDIDFAIMGLRDTTGTKDFDVYKIYRSDNIPVVGEKYAALAKEPLSLDQLAALPLIFVQSGYSIREYYEKLYRKHGLEFVPIIETPTLDIQLKAVRLGLGYSFVPYPHIKESLENGSLYMLDIIGEKVLERYVCLLTARERPMSRAAQALVDILMAAADEYCNW